MHDESEATPAWIAGRVKQEAADEWLLAELVKDVIVTLRSRGVNKSQAVVEGYRIACDLVRRCSFYDEQSPLAQVSVALRVLSMALPPSDGPTPNLPTGTQQEHPSFPPDPGVREADRPPKYRGRRREEHRWQAKKRQASSQSHEEENGGSSASL